MTIKTTPRLELPGPTLPFDPATPDPRPLFAPLRFRSWRTGDPVQEDALLVARAECERIPGEATEPAPVWYYALLPLPDDPAALEAMNDPRRSRHLAAGDRIALALHDGDGFPQVWGFQRHEDAIATANVCAMLRDVSIMPRPFLLAAQDWQRGRFSFVAFCAMLAREVLEGQWFNLKDEAPPPPAALSRLATVAGLILLYLQFARRYKGFPNMAPPDDPARDQ